MESRGTETMLQNFGFRLQYNRLYKPEYLPARVRYNQFFFMVALGVGLSATRGKVRFLHFQKWLYITFDFDICLVVGLHQWKLERSRPEKVLLYATKVHKPCL